MNDDDRYTRVTLRIPKELTARLREAADRASHSMNAEIVQRLEGSFGPSRQVFDESGFPVLESNQDFEQLNLLSSAIQHEENTLNLIKSGTLVKETSQAGIEGAIAFAELKIEAMKANYRSIAKKIGIRLDPEDIRKILW